MLQLRTVLCPIDFSDLSSKELALGIEVCRQFGARLVLHHNDTAGSSGFPRSWEREGQQAQESGAPAGAEDRLQAIVAGLPSDVVAEARLSVGPLPSTLLDLARDLPADLMILGSHGWSTPQHASVTERIVERSPCPLLTLHDGVDPRRFVLQAGKVDVLVPTDLTETGAYAMAYAFELARRLPMRVHILHVAARGADAAILDALLQQLYGLVPADLTAVPPLEAIEADDEVADSAPTPAAPTSSVECYVRRGDPTEEILLFGEHLDPTFVVMGEHAHTFFRRHFTRDSAVEVLHSAPWPVWFVPARQPTC